MNTAIVNWIKKHQLISFFGFAYAIMFGVLFTFKGLNPSKPLVPWSLVWFFSIFSPSFSALIVAWIIGGVPEIKRLLAGFTRWKMGFRWYFAAAFLFLGPLVIALVYKALGNPAAGLQPGATFSSLAGIVVFTLFSGPIAEEMGWRGFALPRLQSKHNALVSSLILGTIHCFWHLPLYFITGSSQIGIPFPIYFVLVVTQAIYATWLFNNSHGSLILTILAHFAFNLTGFLTGPLGMMPPMVFYMTAGPMLGVVVVAIIFGFGPRYFSKKPVVEMPFLRKTAALQSGD